MSRRGKGHAHVVALQQALVAERARVDSLVRALEEELRPAPVDVPRATERDGDRETADELARRKARALLARLATRKAS